jgi:hypothetical protein
MLARENSGFSWDAVVRDTAQDSAGSELLLRQGAGPLFALERLDLLGEKRVAHRLTKS